MYEKALAAREDASRGVWRIFSEDRMGKGVRARWEGGGNGISVGSLLLGRSQPQVREEEDMIGTENWYVLHETIGFYDSPLPGGPTDEGGCIRLHCYHAWTVIYDPPRYRHRRRS